MSVTLAGCVASTETQAAAASAAAAVSGAPRAASVTTTAKLHSAPDSDTGKVSRPSLACDGASPSPRGVASGATGGIDSASHSDSGSAYDSDSCGASECTSGRWDAAAWPCGGGGGSAERAGDDGWLEQLLAVGEAEAWDPWVSDSEWLAK